MSLLLRVFTQFIVQIMLLLSFLLVLRGHNHPGGGFIGALVATAAIALYTLAFGWHRGFARFLPMILVLGLVLLWLGIVMAILWGEPLLTGIWWDFTLWGEELKFGTPLLFDFGIYFVVFGSLAWLIIELEGRLT